MTGCSDSSLIHPHERSLWVRNDAACRIDERPCVRDAELTGASMSGKAELVNACMTFSTSATGCPTTSILARSNRTAMSVPCLRKTRCPVGTYLASAASCSRTCHSRVSSRRRARQGCRVPVVSHYGEQHSLPVGKPGWQTVAYLLPLRVRLGQDLGLPALSRNP